MSTEGIIKEGRNCWSVEAVETTGVLIDARDYYRAFYDAAGKARNYILVSGWQFNSGVRLLRGADAHDAASVDLGFLSVLNSLCAGNPGLRIYILAWNFSLLFMFEREWLQERIFKHANPRISFHFDRKHAFSASHHQKFVVIDGCLSFVGGMDICESRWDDRHHRADNPERRDPNGRPYGPYHDVQSYQTGKAAEKVAGLFKGRWLAATGETLNLPDGSGGCLPGSWQFAFPLAADSVAISRTLLPVGKLRPIKEIRALYTDAIRSARHLIYIENQYFSSYAVYKALIKKMKSARERMQIIIVLPMREQTLLGNIYIGIAQARLISSLKRVARRKRHSIGVYYPASRGADGRDEPIFVHSKVMIIDDRFMTIGSANTNNRSMGLDSELNVAWEAKSADGQGLQESIRRVRMELLSEHVGVTGAEAEARLVKTEGLVDFLQETARLRTGSLRPYGVKGRLFTARLLKRFNLDTLLVDPEKEFLDHGLTWAIFKGLAQRIGRIFK